MTPQCVIFKFPQAAVWLIIQTVTVTTLRIVGFGLQTKLRQGIRSSLDVTFHTLLTKSWLTQYFSQLTINKLTIVYAKPTFGNTPCSVWLNSTTSLWEQQGGATDLTHTHTNVTQKQAGVSFNTFIRIFGSWDNSNCKHATGGISHWRREGWGNTCKCVCGPRCAAADLSLSKRRTNWQLQTQTS